ncbi:YciI family protein [Polaromonas sp. CF318]|uniref:YciI family protein n=1 Tax=Polaromonas sp. CF318 TaxID=1144318 RepID=UPI001EE68C59|nr:YciI family protein [Polaromonas sp. CF318]
MILLKANDRAEAGIVPDSQWLGRMARHNDEAVKAGVLLMGEGLKPSASASRLKFTRGKPSVMDGPFAEAKELLAGFWIIQARSLQAAVDWALDYPFPFRDTEEVEVEIRLLYEMADFGMA